MKEYIEKPIEVKTCELTVYQITVD